MKICGFNAFLLIVLGILFLGQILAISDHQIAGIEGLRCDSCGQECSVVCGSRQFRTCCFNYIKKRGDPALSPLSGQESGHEDISHSSISLAKVGDVKKPNAMASRFPSRHFRRSVGGGLVGPNNDLVVPPMTLEYPEDPTWYPFINADIYGLEDEDRTHGSRFRLF